MNEERTRMLFSILIVLLGATVVVGAFQAVTVTDTSGAGVEFYLLTESQNNKLKAGNLSTSTVIYAGIRSHASTERRFKIVVQGQVTHRENNRIQVKQRQNIENFSVSVKQNQRRMTEINVSDISGGRMTRVVFLLYEGTVPQTPTLKNAHRSTYYWINRTN